MSQEAPVGAEPAFQASSNHALETDSTRAISPEPAASVTTLDSTIRRDNDESNAEGDNGTQTKRNNNSSNANQSSVFSGNRIRYLKKKDGEPFWRRDLQYNFLREIFGDEHRVFTLASDGSPGHTFADIYIDAMIHSSKCSQVLRDRLRDDRPAAIDMAVICLLVNVGRMNTTLNFFPEMRARVRTYHPIPCLQAQQKSNNVSKQLQDGPRLKSILKGAQEDIPQPTTIEALEKMPSDRGNAVNLLFLLAQWAPKISEKHFVRRDFFDLFVKDTISSASRARALLWLVWWYLEGDFSEEAAAKNPFGAGEAGPEEGGIKTKVPHLEIITERQADEENKDTEEELAYGDAKRRERETILATDPPPPRSVKRSGKSGGGSGGGGGGAGLPSRMSPYSDSDSDTSPPFSNHHLQGWDKSSPTPEMHSGFLAANQTASGNTSKMKRIMPDETPLKPKSTRTSSARGRKEVAIEPAGSSTYPAIAPSTMPGNPYGQSSLERTPVQLQWDGQPATSESTKPKRGARSAMTTDQQRRHRTDLLLFSRMHHQQTLKKTELRQRGSLLDAWIKCKGLPDGYDSDEDVFGRRGGIDEIGNNATAATADDGHDLSDVENVPYGDIGARATLLAHAFGRVGKVLDGVRVRRPRGIYPPPPQNEAVANSTKTLGSQSNTTPYSRVRIHDASSPAPGSVASKEPNTGKSGGDETRKKRQYKSRAKKGEGQRGNAQNKQLNIEGRDKNKGAASPSPATEGNSGRRGGGKGGRATTTEGGSMKRKRGQTREDGDGVQKGQVGVPMDVWASGANSSPSTKKRQKVDDATEDEHSVVDMDLDEELLGGDDYDEHPSEGPGDDDDDDDDGDIEMQEDEDDEEEDESHETDVANSGPRQTPRSSSTYV